MDPCYSCQFLFASLALAVARTKSILSMSLFMIINVDERFLLILMIGAAALLGPGSALWYYPNALLRTN